ncbi:DUF4157 domain-containing protein [Anabaena azotica]|uniref:eCIS core domain-containing protein n=1 Tax=Anabaena azotica TaxID=197653 RepID=UPI0039A40552
MNRQQVTQNNQQSKNETPLVRGILQRAAVHSQEEESSDYSESRFHQDFSQVPVTNTESVIQAKSNKTGLPDNLKAGIEDLSGIAMDDVRVHYNSSKPSQLQALAYTQGTEIHVAPGQEKHLPHEAWHVVQQKLGRVRPIIQAKGVGINDDEGLENEANVMGNKAIHRTKKSPIDTNTNTVCDVFNLKYNSLLQGRGLEGKRSELRKKGTIKSLINDSSLKTVQRHISWVTPPGQFQIDADRPGWMDGVGAMALGPGQSRNHIVDFENIQNDLANILNTIVAAPTLANQNHLIRFTDALMPTVGFPRTNMVAMRTALITSMTAGPPAVANFHTEARALLSRLNSSPDNVRVGNAAINTSIGQNLDADFIPGTVLYPGGNVRTHVAPAGVHQGPTTVLTLTPASNAIVYQYQQETTQMITFVINPANRRQLSSVTGPTVGTALPLPPHPVLVTDPSGVGLPFLYT